MKLSDNLKKIRKENNLSQEQLAEKLGVSRQAVSKWESGQSYPEMEKVLLICKLFNYNMDELMNENVKEVNENKQAKININKYIDDFFEFITKTVDMLSSMKFKQKMKCLIEQFVIAMFLLSVFVILGEIGSNIISGIFGGLPDRVYYIIRNILDAIYLFLAVIVGITILLHIFKVRYLDYYEIVKEDENQELEENNTVAPIEKEDNKKKIFIEKKKEKVIIRDPKHSQSKFLTGIIRIVLWCIKFIAAWIAVGFAFSFITFVALLVLSFLFIKTGLVFVGAFCGLVSTIIVNFIILNLLYNFIVSKKVAKTRFAILFISSLVLLGLSIGMILIGTLNFNYTDEVLDENLEESTYQFEMTESLSINHHTYATIQYNEVDSNEVNIVIKYLKYQKINCVNEQNVIYLYAVEDESKIMEFIREVIKDINNKKIKNYDYIPEITISTSKENIEKLKQNTLLNHKQQEQNQIDNLSNTIRRLESQINELENKAIETESLLEEKDIQITDLENQIIEKDSQILEALNQVEILQNSINE